MTADIVTAGWQLPETREAQWSAEGRGLRRAGDRARLERRQRGLCPTCGARAQLTGDTLDGRYRADCGDAFWPADWRRKGA